MIAPLSPAALEALRLAVDVAAVAPSHGSPMVDLQLEHLSTVDLRTLLEVILTEHLATLIFGADALELDREAVLVDWLAGIEARHGQRGT